MNELTKIRDVSVKYGITTRTLRYYEDFGLIKSGQIAGYAYRCYDNENLMKIEQILILRKLNISLKDIKKIFESDSSQTILNVLSNKVKDIDAESALLHELKQIIIEFVKQIEKYDFTNEADIKLLYQRAYMLEEQVKNSTEQSKPVNKMIEITDQLQKEIEVRVVKLPAMTMLLSPCGSPEEENGELQQFFNWVKQEFFNNEDEYPYGGGLPLYSWNTEKGLQFIVKKPMSCTSHNWQEFQFAGGYYAVFSAWLPEIMEKYQGVMKWLKNSDLYQQDKKAELESRRVMSNIITPIELREKLQNEQHDVYVPIMLV